MDALLRRLAHYTEIGDDERGAIKALPVETRSFSTGNDLVSKGEHMPEAFIVKSGWAARYLSFKDGRAQVLNFMLPGDMFDLQVFISNAADHSISALTDVDILCVSRQDIFSLFANGNRAGAAFWWATLQEEAILREQIVRNGRRSARERIAHLLLELHRRAVIVGEGRGNQFRMPISQVLIADALGLSFVHVNRVIRSFERDRLIDRDKSSLELLDRETLIDMADFSEDYLHLDQNRQRLFMHEPRP